ncbi:hypothetical protein GCM10009639_60170 [Kitasatospora putterlickiae]|uniref:Lipoprotein n=1 Tax=Kitasatospora putterlickiae TaxID=221725 RepID=A0ABP4J3T3_9ACTN
MADHRGRLLGAALLVATLGACTSSGPGGGKGDPLPVKPRAEAVAWARDVVEHLALVVEVRLNDKPAGTNFSRCFGKKREPFFEDRYELIYSATSDTPDVRHAEVVRRARDRLLGDGFEVTDFRVRTDGTPRSLVAARHPGSRHQVSVRSGEGGDSLAFVVITPCLQEPPGG